jgi:hypothetical protein
LKGLELLMTYFVLSFEIIETPAMLRDIINKHPVVKHPVVKHPVVITVF